MNLKSARAAQRARRFLERLAQYIIRNPFAADEGEAAGQAVQIIGVSEHQPRRIPSASRAEGETGLPQGSNGAKRSGNWRELIKKVWGSDPLLCPKCRKETRIVCCFFLTPLPWLSYRFHDE